MMLASGPSSPSSFPRRHSITQPAQHSLSSALGLDPARPSSANAHPSPHVLNRRHSLALMRKPLRSSPLAGPALSSEGASKDETPMTRCVRTPSTPNLRSLARSSPPPPLPTPPPASKRLSKRASLLDIVKRPLAHKKLSDFPPLPYHLHTTIFSSALFTTSLPTSPCSRAFTEFHGRIHVHDRSFRRPPAKFPPRTYSAILQPAHLYSPLPRATVGMPVYDAATGGHGQNDSGENWLASTPYSSTPRFSRLSLAAPNVVLPVSARAARRQSVRGEGGKRVSLVHPTPAVPPPRSSNSTDTISTFSASTPSLLSRSSLSSEGPTTPSPSVFGADSGVLAEDGEYAEEVDLALVSSRDFDVASSEDALSEDNAHTHLHVVHAHKPASLLADAPNTWDLSMRRHRRSYAKGMSIFSFGSDSTSTSTSASVFSPAHSPAHSPAPSYSPAAPPRAQSAPYFPAREAYNPYFDSDLNAHASMGSGNGNGSGAKKAAETVRRLLRSFSRRGA
ncbi:hypothetical protein B0H13DRAFT_2435148 [Mycena leptocephala]|nr:hypothetical protein B0H13DRAFT_2435148 [Mycena leptocephala]